MLVPRVFYDGRKSYERPAPSCVWWSNTTAPRALRMEFDSRRIPVKFSFDPVVAKLRFVSLLAALGGLLLAVPATAQNDKAD